MPSFAQRSMAGGEIAPALYGRADQAKYQTGLRTCRNFLVQRFGGVTNRTGSEYVADVKTSADETRLLKFIFSDEQTYVIEVGDFYLRFHRLGAPVLLGTLAAWVTATDYAVGDLVASGGVNYYCRVAHTSGATTEPGVGAVWATRWYAMPGSILELPTPWPKAHVLELRTVQSGDVVIIVHRSHEPRRLSRLGTNLWAIDTLEYEPEIGRSENNTVAVGGAGANTYRYAVTAVNAAGRESKPFLSDTPAISSVALTSPWLVTLASAHGMQTGDEVAWRNLAFASPPLNQAGTITVLSPTTFTIDDPFWAEELEANFNGTLLPDLMTNRIRALSAAAPTSGAPHVLTITPVDGATEYVVYKELNGRLGFIGYANGTTFSDVGYDPDTSLTIPVRRDDLFTETGDYPGVVTLFQQRLVLASTDNKPESVWLSVVGDYYNFAVNSPLQDDDSVSFTMAGRKVSAVRGLVDLGKLVVLTSGAEYTLLGDGNGAITPTQINAVAQSTTGSADLEPVTVADTALFVQARGSIVRDLQFEFATDGYRGRDLTVYAPHLFDGYSIRDWDYAQTPHSIVWAVRDDGTLLGLTYVREHDVWGWHRHDTDGTYEQVVVVPEGDEDAVYVIVRRTINGSTKRYIERFARRRIDSLAADAKFLDCMGTYDGRHTGSTTMTLSGGVTWGYEEDLTLTASGSTFVVGDVGNEYWLTIGDETIRCRVLAYTSGTVVTVQAHKDVPVAFQGVAVTVWAKAVDELSGLGWLEGKTVGILADGFVHPEEVVTAGAITLDRPHSIVHVGLPIVADLETLNLEQVNGESLIDKKKRVKGVTCLVEASRGFFAGPDLDNLRETKLRAAEAFDEPIDPVTGPVEVLLNSSWDDNGRVAIRQTDPLPLTILSIVPSTVVVV